MNLTQAAQQFLRENLTLDDALPTRMPVYVSSVAYLFGVSALSALVLLILTGVVLAIFGPTWYHVSHAGLFVNSLHFWSVQLFFGATILHLLTKYLMAAWRDGRWKNWIVGVVISAAAIFTALTGYLSQTNLDAQWIAVQSKDAVNAWGIGGFLNTMNTGQILTLHVVALPLLVVVFLAVHLYLIRHDSPVKPLPLHGGEA